MILSKTNTKWLFSLTCKRRMIPGGNTVPFKIYIAWDYEEICPFYWNFFYLCWMFTLCGWLCYYVQISHYWWYPKNLQHTIKRLEKWTLKNAFTICKNKTVAMHFCLDKKCMDPVLIWDNDPIQFVKEAKFLGLIWDTKLNFEPHIKFLKARCQKSLNLLKVHFRTEWGADRTTLLKQYGYIRIRLWLYSLWISF